MTVESLGGTFMAVLGPWTAVATTVLAMPAQASVRIPHHEIPHPEQHGFYRSVGLQVAARRHYRHALVDGRGLHVQVFRDHYRVHWDRVDPSVSVLRHLLHDVTRTLARPFRRRQRRALRAHGHGQ